MKITVDLDALKKLLEEHTAKFGRGTEEYLTIYGASIILVTKQHQGYSDWEEEHKTLLDGTITIEEKDIEKTNASMV